MLRFAAVAFLLLLFALPLRSRTNKVTNPNACGELWTAVTDTLGNAANYTVKVADETP